MGVSLGSAASVAVVMLSVILSGPIEVVGVAAVMRQTVLAAVQQPTRVVPSGPPLYEKAPHSLKELLGLADLVIVGTVERSEQSFITSEAAGRVIVRPIVRSGIRVEELVKGKAATGALVDVAQTGGSVVVRGVQYTADNPENPVLVVGERAIFLLKRWPSASAFGSVLGPAGVLRVSGTTVKIPKELQHIPDLAIAPDRPLPALIGLMRGLAGGRSVTYVPGMKCYLCGRNDMAAGEDHRQTKCCFANTRPEPDLR